MDHCRPDKPRLDQGLNLNLTSEYGPESLWKGYELFLLQGKVCEEHVALTKPEVVQKDVWLVARILEETEDREAHLHNLQRRQLLIALHVVSHIIPGSSCLWWRKKERTNDKQ